MIQKIESYIFPTALISAIILSALSIYNYAEKNDPTIDIPTPTIEESGSPNENPYEQVSYPDPSYDPAVPAIPLKTTWQSIQKSRNLGFWRYAFDTPQQTYGIDYYKVGRITANADFADADIYIAKLACEGPCFYPLLYYFAVSPTGASIILRESDPMSYAPQGWLNNFAIDTKHSLDGLRFPDEIPFSGHKLIRDKNVRQFFDDKKKKRILAKYESLGTMYTNSKNGFIFRAPDGTARVYSLQPNFTTDNIPSVTWLDGSKNRQEYHMPDIGGCGDINYTSVVDENQIKPTDLMQSGVTIGGDPIFELKNQDHALLHDIYDNQYHEPYGPDASGATGTEGDRQVKKSYAVFVNEHPVFFWRDPFNRLIKFQRKDFLLQAECGKPVIYLYPKQKTRINVQVSPIGGFSKTIPTYPDNGWNVIASPDGTITNTADHKTYPYLFWEGRGGIYQKPERGFIVKNSEIETFLRDKLTALGLNEIETRDFMEFWQPKMTESPFYRVSFYGNQVMDQLAPLSITPKPDSIIRILMDFEGIDAPIEIKPQIIRTPTRDGFTVIEWGGVIQ